MSVIPVPERIVATLKRRVSLNDDDRAALRGLSFVHRHYQPQSYMIREGGPVRSGCAFILSGFAYRQKLTNDGARQIVSVHMTNDFIDLQHLFLRIADHNVQALTFIEVVEIARHDLQQLALTRPNIGRALWIDGLIDASIAREWVLNIGRRDARARIAHILCELAVRMELAGLKKGHLYDLPLTQEQMGDAVGLTSVHVNRTLKALVRDGLIALDRRNLAILDWDGLRRIGDFGSLYLHLDQGDGLEAAPVI